MALSSANPVLEIQENFSAHSVCLRTRIPALNTYFLGLCGEKSSKTLSFASPTSIALYRSHLYCSAATSTAPPPPQEIFNLESLFRGIKSAFFGG
jgi:hypothetical protein